MKAFLVATYLINPVPSKVIDFENPLEHLFQQKPDYTSLRVFGCACWPNLWPYNKCKLEFRSKQCPFLGYSNLHKGFKCLDISTGRVYVSRDVIFDEMVFPFSTLHPNAGAHLRSEIALLPTHLLSPTVGMEHIADPVTNPPDFSDDLCENSDENSSPGASNNGADDHNGINTEHEDDSAPVAGESSADPGVAPSQDPGPLAADLLRHSPIATSPVVGHSPPAPRPHHVVTSTQPGAVATEGEQVGTRAPLIAPETTASPDLGSSELPRSSAPARPRTRLQSGIHKEKVYTDGTVKYEFLLLPVNHKV